MKTTSTSEVSGIVARRRATIPLTSLVDVVFILLFFFMLASRFSGLQGIDLNLGAADQRAVAAIEETWFLQLYADEALVLNGQSVAPAELQGRLAAQPGVHLVVQPGEGVSLQRLVSLMDELRASGARLATGVAP